MHKTVSYAKYLYIYVMAHFALLLLYLISILVRTSVGKHGKTWQL